MASPKAYMPQSASQSRLNGQIEYQHACHVMRLQLINRDGRREQQYHNYVIQPVSQACPSSCPDLLRRHRVRIASEHFLGVKDDHDARLSSTDSAEQAIQ